MKKARVFISSTIYDFKDIRSALKYWLNELGYDVQLSENTDFQADIDKNSYNACLENIKNCDYFILFIGSRVGGWYDSVNKISITQAEYRKAYDLMKIGNVKLISFVRKEIFDIKEERKSLSKFLSVQEDISSEIKKKVDNYPSKFFNNAEFISNFINEVSRNAEMKKAINGEIELPKANWIYQFTSFEDIVNVLKTQLNAKTDIQFKVHGENILRELSSNVAYLRNKNDKGITPFFLYANDARKRFPNVYGGKFEVTIKELLPLQFFALFSTLNIDHLSDINIQTALSAGVFFIFKKEENVYVPSDIHIALQKMDEEIRLLKGLKELFDSTCISKIIDIIKPYSDSEDKENIVNIDYIGTHEFIILFSIHDRLSNIIGLFRYIFACIKHPEEKYDFPELYDRSPIKDIMSESYFGTPSPEEIYQKFNI